MRIAAKLTVVLVVPIVLVLTVHGGLRFVREQRMLTEDTVRDHRLVARGLALALDEAYLDDRDRGVTDTVDAANAQGSAVQVAWQWTDGLVPGRWTIADDELTTEVPIAIGDRWGTLSLAESVAPHRRYLAASMLRTAAFSVLLIVAAGAAISVATRLLVTNPVRQLVAHSRRVGDGDLDARVALRQSDEIGQLANALEAMTIQLGEARHLADAEARRRADALEQLRHADRLATVGVLAAGVAHELGSPLGVIGLHAQLIAGGELVDEEARAGARIIDQQVDRMASIVRGILDFARRGEPRREPVDLLATVEKVFVALGPMARGRRVTLLAPGGVRAWVTGDPSHLEQIVFNLAVNAIDAVPTNGRVAARVGVVDATSPGGRAARWVRLEVVDDGPGIPPELVSRVFEPFFTTKDVGAGTGLGLSVAWGLVQDHDGWIDIISPDEGGTTFRVHLPFAAPPAPGDRHAR